MDDRDGPVVAKAVYAGLFNGASDILKIDSVPYALDAVVTSLREQGLHPSRWAPYIHIGA